MPLPHLRLIIRSPYAPDFLSPNRTGFIEEGGVPPPFLESEVGLHFCGSEVRFSLFGGRPFATGQGLKLGREGGGGGESALSLGASG